MKRNTSDEIDLLTNGCYEDARDATAMRIQDLEDAIPQLGDDHNHDEFPEHIPDWERDLIFQEYGKLTKVRRRLKVLDPLLPDDERKKLRFISDWIDGRFKKNE